MKSFIKKVMLSIINCILVAYFSMRKRSPKKGPVAVVGMFRAATGLGNSVRLILDTLQHIGFKTTYFDVSQLFVKNFIRTSLPEPLDRGEGGVLLIKNNPIHLPLILFLIGFSRIRNKRIILCAVYELSYIPSSWIKPCRLVDEIWVPSNFSADVYRNFVPEKPVYMVPDFVRVGNLEDIKIKKGNNIRILSVFDINSGFYRKNPMGVLEVFSRINRSNVDFVIKVSGREGNEKYYDMILQEASKIQNMTVINKKLSDKEKNKLIASADILVSLHRSEGFGLILAEAMLLGTPILCTGWSAPPTFLPDDCASYVNYKLIDVDDPQGKYQNKGQWADPRLEDAVKKLENLIGDKKLRNKMSKKAQDYAEKYFSEKNFESWVMQSKAIKEYAEK